jgi:5-methylcytosine-specific restriction protein B
MELMADAKPKIGLMNLDYKTFHQKSKESGLTFTEKNLCRFISSLLTKPFVILTGLSGSGKTKLAQAFAMWICESKVQYCIVPVGADWTNREPLLGFPNALIDNDYKKDEYGVLKLIIDANDNPDKPYFLILDEMNLSHVERYFADFLSVMESKSKISLHSGNEDWNSVPPEIGFPKNLFIIGTVNIDETTYMFSPKVLDRANVIEFRVTIDEMENYLQSNSFMNLDKLEGLGAAMAGNFVEIANDDTLEASDTEELNKSLMNFFSELKKTGAEFGYRSASEILRFAGVVNKIEPTWSMAVIIDTVIMQKLLPKVHGSRRKLEPVLKTLGQLCLEDGQKFDDLLITKTEIDFKYLSKIKYPVSLEKILRMYDNLISNGFTSYAEA